MCVSRAVPANPVRWFCLPPDSLVHTVSSAEPRGPLGSLCSSVLSDTLQTPVPGLPSTYPLRPGVHGPSGLPSPTLQPRDSLEAARGGSCVCLSLGHSPVSSDVLGLKAHYYVRAGVFIGAISDGTTDLVLTLHLDQKPVRLMGSDGCRTLTVNLPQAVVHPHLVAP